MNGSCAWYFGESKPARATGGVQLPGFDVESESVVVLS